MTLDQLQRRGWSLTNRCFMCQAHEESIDYILLHCSKAWELWELLFFLFGDYWVIPSFIRDILLGWYDSFVRRKWKKVWGVVPYAWTIWTERNRRSFASKELSEQKLKSLFLCSLLAWTKLYIVEGLMFLFDFIDLLGSLLGRE